MKTLKSKLKWITTENEPFLDAYNPSKRIAYSDTGAKYASLSKNENVPPERRYFLKILENGVWRSTYIHADYGDWGAKSYLYEHC